MCSCKVVINNLIILHIQKTKEYLCYIPALYVAYMFENKIVKGIVQKQESTHRNFIWVIVWPFIPASLRYFDGVAEFEIVGVLSISISGVAAYLLWGNTPTEKPRCKYINAPQ